MINAEVWFEHIQRLIADNHWPSITAMMVNLHLITDVSSIGEPEIKHAIALFNSMPGALSNKRIAVVAGDAFWKSRRFGELIGPYGPSVLVFNDLSTACTIWVSKYQTQRRSFKSCALTSKLCWCQITSARPLYHPQIIRNEYQRDLFLARKPCYYPLANLVATNNGRLCRIMTQVYFQSGPTHHA